MFSTDVFIDKINKKSIKNEKIRLFLFGVIFGIVLLIFSVFRLITDTNLKNDWIYFTILFISGIDFFILLFIPSKLKYLEKIPSTICKIFTDFILSALLIIIYIIWFIPSTIIHKLIHKDSNTTFKTKKGQIIRKVNNNLFNQLINIFSYFLSSDNLYLLPLIIILIIIGIILFFAQSSAISPLIYPLI